MKRLLLLPLSRKLLYLIITTVLSLSVACGVAALPAEISKISPTSEIMPTVAQKQPILATLEPGGMLDAVLCVSASKSLNLRIAPSTMAAADPDGLQHGERVVRIGAVPGWMKVQTVDGRSGWVKASYLEECDGT